MADMNYRAALIVGAGSGLSASLARAFAAAGLKVALAARSTAKLETIAGETGAKTFTCDAAAPADVAQLFANVTDQIGQPDVVVYNASYRQRGPLIELDPGEVAKSLTVSAYGGFLVAQQAARRMLPHHHGAILFTGAAAMRRIGPTACSIRTPSRRPTCTSSSSRAVSGPGRWSCGRGWRSFEIKR